jgi:hypothetical protein
MKVQLAIAPAPLEYVKNPRYACFPPLDLLSLATYVSDKCPSAEIEILDGQILGQDQLLDRIGADFVGISPRISGSYPKSVAAVNPR